MKIYLAIGVLAIGTLTGAAARATEISGDIEFDGEATFLGGDGSAGQATGVNFVQMSAGGGSGAGTVEITDTSGGFTQLFNYGNDCASFRGGGCGQVKNIPTGGLVTGYGPIATEFSFTLDGHTVTADLTDITQISRFGTGASSFLNVFGLATLYAPGYTATNTDFSFTFHGTGSDTSFSGDIAFVPEPASIMIFGAALVGVGVMRRRRDTKLGA